MCELLGMSASVPTDINFSLSGLIPREEARQGDIKMVGRSLFMKVEVAERLKNPSHVINRLLHALCKSTRLSQRQLLSIFARQIGVMCY